MLTLSVAAQSLPSDVVLAGGAYTPGSTAAGWATYARLVSQATQLYSFSTYQSTIVAGKLQTSTTTGFATVVKQLGPLSVLAFAQAGIATTTASTGAFAGGGFAVLRLGKTKWILGGGYEALKGTANPQKIFKLGLGRTM
jgi:hypothetical protein